MPMLEGNLSLRFKTSFCHSTKEIKKDSFQSILNSKGSFWTERKIECFMYGSCVVWEAHYVRVATCGGCGVWNPLNWLQFSSPRFFEDFRLNFLTVRLIAGRLLKKKMCLNLCYFYGISRIFVIFTPIDSSFKNRFHWWGHKLNLVEENIFADFHICQWTMVAKKTPKFA